MVANGGIESQVVVLHTFDPGRVIDSGVLLDTILVGPASHDKVACYKDELRILRLNCLEDIVERVLPAGLRVGQVHVQKIRDTHESPGLDG